MREQTSNACRPGRWAMAGVLSVGVLSASTGWAATSRVTSVTELVAAVAAASPGDVIAVADGTYKLSSSLILDRAGTQGGAITLEAERRGAAILQGNGSVLDVVTVAAPWWILDGLTVSAGVTTGIKVLGAGSHLVVRGATLWGSGEAELRGECGGPDTGSHCDDVLIEDSDIYRTTPGTSATCTAFGVDVIGGDRWTIRASRIRSIQINEFNCPMGSAWGVAVRGNAHAAIVDANDFYANQTALSFGANGTFECQARGAATGASCASLLGICEVTGSLASNNIVTDSSVVGMAMRGACLARLFNNTLWRNGLGGVARSIDIRLARSSVDVGNNILNGAVRDLEGAAHVDVNNHVLTTSDEATPFVDTTARDFRVPDDPDIIDKGVSAPDVPADYAGVSRPQGKGWDVGAYELPAGGLTARGDGGAGGGGVGGGGGFLPPTREGCHCRTAPGADPGALGLAVLVGAMLMRARRRPRSS